MCLSTSMLVWRKGRHRVSTKHVLKCAFSGHFPNVALFAGGCPATPPMAEDNSELPSSKVYYGIIKHKAASHGWSWTLSASWLPWRLEASSPQSQSDTHVIWQETLPCQVQGGNPCSSTLCDPTPTPKDGMNPWAITISPVSGHLYPSKPM